jgi:hypothetical protein
VTILDRSKIWINKYQNFYFPYPSQNKFLRVSSSSACQGISNDTKIFLDPNSRSKVMALYDFAENNKPIHFHVVGDMQSHEETMSQHTWQVCSIACLRVTGPHIPHLIILLS